VVFQPFYPCKQTKHNEGLSGMENDKSTCTTNKQRGTILDKEKKQFKCKHFTKFCAGLHEIFDFHGFNFSFFVICFNLVELTLFRQNIKISSLC